MRTMTDSVPLRRYRWLAVAAVVLLLGVAAIACTRTPEPPTDDRPETDVPTDEPSDTPSPAVVEGVVSSLTGTLLSGVEVGVIEMASGQVVSATTGTDGSYRVAVAGPGDYQVHAVPQAGTGLAGEYHLDAEAQARAATVRVEEGGPPTTVNLSLAPIGGPTGVRVDAQSDCAIVHRVVDQVAVCFVADPPVHPPTPTPRTEDTGVITATETVSPRVVPTLAPEVAPVAAGPCSVEISIELPACAGGTVPEDVRVVLSDGHELAANLVDASTRTFTMTVTADSVAAVGRHVMDLRWSCRAPDAPAVPVQQTVGVLGGCDPGGYIRADSVPLPGSVVRLWVDPNRSPGPSTTGSSCVVAGSQAPPTPLTSPLPGLYWNAWSGEPMVVGAPPPPGAIPAGPAEIGDQPNPMPVSVTGQYGWVAEPGCYYVQVLPPPPLPGTPTPWPTSYSPLVGVVVKTPQPDDVTLDMWWPERRDW